MRNILLSTLAAGLGLVFVSAAYAAPINGSAVSTIQDSKNLIPVAGGCGPRRHWSFHRHHCVWN